MVWSEKQVAHELKCAEMEMLDGTVALCRSHEELRAQLLQQNERALDLANECALWRNLSKQQDKLLAAYRTGRKDVGAVLDKMDKYRKALEPFVQAAVLRVDAELASGPLTVPLTVDEERALAKARGYAERNGETE